MTDTRRNLCSNRNVVTLFHPHIFTHRVKLPCVVYRQGKEITAKRKGNRKVTLGPPEGRQKRKRGRWFVEVSVNSCQQWMEEEEKKVGKQEIKWLSLLWPTTLAGLRTHLVHLFQTLRPQSRRRSYSLVWLVTAYTTALTVVLFSETMVPTTTRCESLVFWGIIIRVRNILYHRISVLAFITNF